MADGLARQIAGLMGDIRNLGKRIPSYQRGVVANVSPPTVVMDRDVTATPRPVADVLVPGLAVGQRVEVRVIGSRRVITSIHPADIPPPPPHPWVALTLSTGFSGSGEARVKNGDLQLRGTILRDTGNFPTAFENVALLPVGMEPSSTLRIMTAPPPSATFRAVVMQVVSGSRQIQAATVGPTAYNTLYLTGITAPTD